MEIENRCKMKSHNKEILLCVLDEVWSKGMCENLQKYIAPSYVVQNDPGDPFDGQTLDIKGYEARVMQIRAPFPDQEFDALEMVEEGDKVAVSWRWKGSHLGDILGIAASGKLIHMTGMTIYSFKEGKLSGHWQMVDRLSVFQQLSQMA